MIGDSFTTPSSEIRIDGVELVDAEGMVLEDAWLTEPEGAVGSLDYPPIDLPLWDDRVPAVGAVIAPETLQTIAFLVRRIGDEPGTSAAFAITYSVGPWSFRDTGTLSVELKDKCF